MSAQLSAVLSDAHLEKKETEMRKYGVTEVDDLKELDDNDYKALGFNRGEKKKLAEALKKHEDKANSSQLAPESKKDEEKKEAPKASEEEVVFVKAISAVGEDTAPPPLKDTENKKTAKKKASKENDAKAESNRGVDDSKAEVPIESTYTQRIYTPTVLPPGHYDKVKYWGTLTTLVVIFAGIISFGTFLYFLVPFFLVKPLDTRWKYVVDEGEAEVSHSISV